MNLIVAVDKNWAIGYQNKLLVSSPGGYEVLPHCHHRKSGRHGPENPETFRTACP